MVELSWKKKKLFKVIIQIKTQVEDNQENYRTFSFFWDMLYGNLRKLQDRTDKRIYFVENQEHSGALKYAASPNQDKKLSLKRT